MCILFSSIELTATQFRLSKFETTFTVISFKIDIISFINTNRSQFPEISVVADILFGIPPSQSAVERSFSQLSFIFNSLRNSLSPALLEKLLLIRLNKNIVTGIFEEELNILSGTR